MSQATRAVSPEGLGLPVCSTCGVQYGAARPDCPICLDERQYVGWDGQQWTTLAGLRAEGHRAHLDAEGPDVIGVGVEPAFAVGQRALLIRAPGGNVLWDCVGYLDDELVAQIEHLGGISAVAVSHPHFYGAMTEWARVFDAPLYVHAADRQWVPRPDPLVEFWDGETRAIAQGMTLINAGTHFPGGTVLHWADDPDGRGALFSGDIFMVVMDRRWLSFMHSVPNFIPERPSAVRRALELIRPFAFERIYGGFWRRVVETDGVGAVRRSAERYLRFTGDRGDDGDDGHSGGRGDGGSGNAATRP